MKRIVFVGLVLVGGLVEGIAEGGNLSIAFNYPGNEVIVLHIEGASDGWDPSDAATMNPMPGDVGYHSKVSFVPYILGIDARPPESMTNIETEIFGNNLSGGSEVGNIDFYFNNMINFQKKFIYAKLFQRQDDGEGGFIYNLIGTYDVKAMDIVSGSGEAIPITVLDGITQDSVFYPSHKLYIGFYNYADINRDGKVNNKDFGFFYRNWRRTGVEVGSDPEALGDYSDINRDSNVDPNDLKVFCSEWLWGS